MSRQNTEERDRGREAPFSVDLGEGFVGQLLGGLLTRVRRALADRGWRIRLMPTDKVDAVDVRQTANHPASILYHGERTAESVLVDLPIDRGYSIEAFPLAPGGPHPFVCAIQRAEESSNPREAIRRVLAEYYRTVQPTNAAEWLGLSPDEVPELANAPCCARLMPWDAETIDERYHGVQSLARSENRRYGKPLGIDHGWKLCGPVTEPFLELQTDRLHSLYRSFKEQGLVRHDELDGDIRTAVLIDEHGDWRWLQCGGGFHRSAVASALGYRTIPVRIWRLIFREHVDLWPQVASGEFSRRGALKLFDRIFSGRPASVAQPWAAQYRRSTRRRVQS